MRIKAKSLLTVFLLTIITFTLVACNGLTPNPTTEEKAVPVYQGMEVSETLITLSAIDSKSSNILKLSNIGVTRNLNTNPIDQDDPFGTLDTGTISDLIAAEFPVSQTEVADYYSEISKDIFITVKLSNPDNFVILSFTLNGTFYQSYQFQEGSDSENLILKVNTGSVSGIKEYTIDAIKYIDGSDIKDAIFAGEKTITVGLAYSSVPSAIIQNEIINATSMSFDVNLADSSSVSTLNKVVLYNGVEFVQTYDLEVGNNSIVFDKLNINTLYQYAIVSIYDLMDSQDSRLEILDKQAFYTDDIVVIDTVVPTQDSIGFGITVTDVDQVGVVSAIELYQGETLIEALTDLSVREFAGLLSNNEYTINVTYTYDLNDGVGSQTLVVSQAATTLAKATPVVVVDNMVPTQDSISFGITVTDVDHVNNINSIELYNGETLIIALTDLNLREFTGLLSNNEYTIKATYTYDLNDGVGEQTEQAVYTASTLAKAIPTVIIDNVVPTQTSIGFGITVTDVDQVGSVSAVELYQGETLIEALTDLSLREFSGLLSNNEYTIKVTYAYDLNDGVGSQTLVISQAATTIAKAIPATVIDTVVLGQTSIDFSITVTDGDHVNNINSIELYNGETLIIALTDLNLREFTGLLSNNEYTIKIIYAYDLSDGQGIVVDSVTTTVTTQLFDGDGTSNNPYLVRTTIDFLNIDQLPNAEYLLVNDLDFSQVAYQTQGNFGGVLNGNGRSLSNITLSINDAGEIGIFSSNTGIISSLIIDSLSFTYSGLLRINFGGLVVNNIGTISNVQLNGTFNIDTIRAITFGGIAAVNSGDISSSFVNVSVVAKTPMNHVIGGMVGQNTDGVISSNVVNSIIVSTPGPASVVFLGGVVGEMNKGEINNCHTYGFITGKSETFVSYPEQGYGAQIDAGGLIGRVNGGSNMSLQSIWSDVDIQVQHGYIGGIIGEIVSGYETIITNSFSIGNLNFLTDRIYAGHFVGADYSNQLIIFDSRYYVDQSLTDFDSAIDASDATKSGISPFSFISIDTLNLTTESIEFELQQFDYGQGGIISAIELYQGETLIEALTDLTIREFSGLSSNNEYMIKVTYTYDLNDGVGNQEHITSETATTLAQDILINSLTVLNQQISSGDTVIFSVSVINPDNVNLKSVIVNGMEIQLDSTSTTTNLRFRFVINDDMGVVNYIVESIVLSDGYLMDVNNNNSIEFFVMANIFVVDVIQSDDNYYGNMYDTYKVTFNQPIAGYIQQVIANGVNPTIQVVNIENIIIIDDYTIEIQITSGLNIGTQNFKIVSINYDVNSVTYTTNINFEWSEYIVNNEVSYIESVTDLLAMVGDPRLYILSNDIDFTGVNWTPINFTGVLLGNGYKFTNLTIIDYTSTERVKFALFDTINGVINDLYIDNLFISVDKNNDVKLAGLAITNFGVINNVNLSGTIEIVSSGTSEIGGLLVNNEGLIVNSLADIIITNNSKTAYIGGVSAVNSTSAYIRDSNVISSINSSTEITYSSHYIGGLIGYNQGNIDQVSVQTILTVHSSFIFSGGITGYNNGFISNSYTTGIVNSTLQTGYSYGYSSGFVGFNSQTGVIENCYSIVNSSIVNTSINWSSGFVGENQGLVQNSFSSGTGFNQPFVQTQSGIFTSNYSLNTNNAISTNGLAYKESIAEINGIMGNLWDNCIWDFSQIDYITVTYPIFK